MTKKKVIFFNYFLSRFINVLIVFFLSIPPALASFDSGSGDEFGYGESSPVNVGAPVSFTQGTFNTGT
ncbi:MAG: hypothetical protein PHG40_00655, partial [Candidatus Omnitrophica bacterium]|nr:hypothetical protein [Candidatus Omnitrophota bacterium]